MIGITEEGDAGLDLSWVNNLQLVNIIISKFVTVENRPFFDRILANKDKIILHVTCTGWGGTVIEPGVPTYQQIYEGVKFLIELGFPVSQIVLRVDPIFPNTKGIARVEKVLDLFRDTGITRVRYSLLDMYPHVIERFQKVCGKVPYATFQASENNQKMVFDFIQKYDYYTFESCGEPNLPDCIGCISNRDLHILGYTDKCIGVGGYQRPACKCLTGKVELLKNKKQCKGRCLYCYWKTYE